MLHDGRSPIPEGPLTYGVMVGQGSSYLRQCYLSLRYPERHGHHSVQREARRMLRPGGALAIIGMNPHAGRDRWYLHEYFPGTRETDLRRYPSSGTLTDWMIAAGFEHVAWRVAARIMDTRVGAQIWDDPMLHKHATSQLAVLSDDMYAAGVARIETALAGAMAAGTAMVFPVDISLAMVTGRV